MDNAQMQISFFLMELFSECSHGWHSLVFASENKTIIQYRFTKQEDGIVNEDEYSTVEGFSTLAYEQLRSTGNLFVSLYSRNSSPSSFEVRNWIFQGEQYSIVPLSSLSESQKQLENETFVFHDSWD